ncbi:MAG: aryl-sulfate sulfotransferase, partial [Promethearchaeota archaeon]
VSITYNIIGHHDYECNPNSNTIFTLNTYNPEINGTKYVFDIIKEFNLTGELVWSLNTMSFISHTQWCPYHDTISGGKRDLTHGNTVFYDVEEDMIYYNSRNTNTFYKINHTSKDILWGLGEYGNFTLYDKYGRVRDNLFYHAHALEKVDEYTFILFDNDHHNQTDSNSEKSRILEITIDEATMTANESWSWTGPKEYYSFYWGDADRLPNGNRLGAFGTKTHPNTDIGARLVEVNDVGEIVWEMNFPNSDDYIYGVYNMERVCTSPVINPQNDIISPLGKNVSIEWQTWYNFRSRQRVLGSYALYLNGNELVSAPYLFDKFWRATTVECSLSALEAGNTYNLTLVMADETGHTTIDSINVTVTLFYLQRGGSTTVEKGQEQAHISWKGQTVSPLSYELQVNGSLVDDGIWNGDEEITLDFRSFNVGSYFVQFTLFNNSLQVHLGSVRLTVFPSIAPKITNAPTNQTIFWNDSLNLSWELFDQTPEAWAIYLNDVLQYTESWEIQDITAEWVVPILNEGKYNITFLAWDQGNLFSIHTIWLIILSPSPPVIASIPALDLVRWGEEGVTLVWEVHGGRVWQLLQNGSHIANGLIFGNLIKVPLTDWWSRWLPGTYELTLQLLDINLEAAEARCFLTIWLGDAYANELIAGQSVFYRDGSLALGAPDGEYATIYEDYSNGYLTLDLGAGEEVVDGDGADFTVWATGGNYRIWVGSNFTLPLIQAGTGQGEQSFILPDEIDEARYIRIEYFSGANVLLDAVEAIYYNLPEAPEEPTTLPSSPPITTTSKTLIPLIPVIFGFIFYACFVKKLRSILMKRIERR